MISRAEIVFTDGSSEEVFFKTKGQSETDWTFFDTIQYHDRFVRFADIIFFAKMHVRSIKIRKNQKMGDYLLRKYPEAGAYFNQPEVVDYVGDVSIS